MTHPVLQLIHGHSSVRDYSAEPVSDDTLRAIVEAAQRTSTSSNLQLFSVIAVTDQDLRTRLAELCGKQEHVAQAPLFLAWCADLSRLDRVCELRGYTQVTDYFENFLLAAVDAAIAAQTAALAAEALGLGICYIGGLRNNPQQVIDLLALPRLTFPVVGMTVGWPSSRPSPKPRLPQQAVLHYQRYDRAAEDTALAAYDRTMIDTGIYKGRQVPVPGTAAGSGAAAPQMEDYGWLEHSARRVAQPARTALRQFIESQGFGLR